MPDSPPEPPDPVAAPVLDEGDRARAEERVALPAPVVHEAIRREGEAELARPTAALLWSALAAGLSMGFSLVAQGLLQARLPAAGWAPLLVRLGYCVGFLLVILARQQLFTENTLTVILPLLSRRDRATLRQVARLWAAVLCANLAGAFLFALTLRHGGLFDPPMDAVFSAISDEAMAPPPLAMGARAVFSGWLIALMVWMLPAAETSRVFVVALISYLVGVAGLTHVVASSVEAFYALLAGHLAIARLGAFLGMTLAGNITGGVALVAALNHAQVMAGAPQRPSS